MFLNLKRHIENFGDIYDRRTIEYDNCQGVGEVIKKIRKGIDEGTKNYGNWQSNDKIKQVSCVPIYEWDGNFYKDKASAKGIIHKNSGNPFNNMTEAECKKYAQSIGKWIYSGHWGTDPPGCFQEPNHSSKPGGIFYNKTSSSSIKCSKDDVCIEKIKNDIITKSSGTPLNNMTEAECKKYGERIGKWDKSGSWDHLHSGCTVWDAHGNIYYNRHDNNLNCRADGAHSCIEKDSSEEIMRPAQGGTHEDGKATLLPDNIDTRKKEPGEYVHESGKFRMSSVYHTSSWATPSLDGKYGWLARSDRRTSPGWMRMETVSGNVESVKGVITEGKDDSHHVSKFKVYASRNGDVWKQMKDSSGNYEFSGGVEQKTNYFKGGPVQAKYIKFYPTAGGHWRSLKAGYVKDLTGVVNCTGGSGIDLQEGRPWFRFTFNEAKTRSPPNKGDAQYSEGTAATTKKCPPDGSVLIVKRGEIIGGPNNIPVSNLKLLKNGNVYGLKGEMSEEIIGDCGPDATSPGWYSSASEGSFSWSACVKPDANGLRSSLPTDGDAFNSSDGGYRYMFRSWNGSDNNGYNRINNTTSYKDNTQSSNANNGSIYTDISTKIKVQDYTDVNVIRQPCNRGAVYSNPTYDSEFYGETDGTTHDGGESKTYCAGGFKGVTGSIWKCINVNKDAVEGWSGNGTKKTWGTSAAPGYIANYVRDALKSKFGTTERTDLSFFKWGLKTIHPDCDAEGTSKSWNADWGCGGSEGKANMTNTGNKGYLRDDGARWSAPSTTKMKFNLGGTHSVKGIYYKQGHVWGNNTKNLPRHWKIKVGNNPVENANGGYIWALPETDDHQYILFNPNKEYSGNSITLYDISHGSSGLMSFKASFFVKDTDKHSVWRNTSKGCKTTVEKKCICFDGTGATGSACPMDKHEHCSSCTNGYYLNGSKCSLKQCTCSNGTGASGTNCPTNSSEKCTSCNANYGLVSNTCRGCSATEYSPSGTGTCTELSRGYLKNSNGSGQSLNDKYCLNYATNSNCAYNHHPDSCVGSGRGNHHTPESVGRSWQWSDFRKCYLTCLADEGCGYFQLSGDKCWRYNHGCHYNGGWYTFKMRTDEFGSKKP